MTTPKWKNFQGFKLRRKQQIRLNNVIWRAYHMQFRSNACKNKSYSYFIVPNSDTSVANEKKSADDGSKCMKRTTWSNILNLRRWHNYKERRRRLHKYMDKVARKMLMTKFTEETRRLPRSFSSVQPLDDFENDFLYPTGVQGVADVMQPGLVSLQPSIADIIASFDEYHQMNTDDGMLLNRTSSMPLFEKGDGYMSMIIDHVSPKLLATRQSSETALNGSNSMQHNLTYSQASNYNLASNHVPLTINENSVIDYGSQFVNSNAMHLSPTNRTYWSNYPPAHSPSQTLFYNPSLTTPLSSDHCAPFFVNSPSSAFMLSSAPQLNGVLPSLEDDTHHVNAPSLGGLKVYSAVYSLKAADRWKNVNMPSPASPELNVVSDSGSAACQASASVQPVSPQSLPHIDTRKRCRVVRLKHADADSPPVPPISLKPEDDKDKDNFQSSPVGSPDELVERKRIVHITAEQTRRSALKDGVEQLAALLPDIYGVAVKPTNAVILARAADYIEELLEEMNSVRKELKHKREQINVLSKKVSSLQAAMPAHSSGSFLPPNNEPLIRQFIERYIKENSIADVRFWMMAKMLRPLIDSFIAKMTSGHANSSTSAVDTVEAWIDENWFPSRLRPLASDFLLSLASKPPPVKNESDLKEFARADLSKR